MKPVLLVNHSVFALNLSLTTYSGAELYIIQVDDQVDHLLCTSSGTTHEEQDVDFNQNLEHMDIPEKFRGYEEFYDVKTDPDFIEPSGEFTPGVYDCDRVRSFPLPWSMGCSHHHWGSWYLSAHLVFLQNLFTETFSSLQNISCFEDRTNKDRMQYYVWAAQWSAGDLVQY